MKATRDMIGKTLVFQLRDGEGSEWEPELRGKVLRISFSTDNPNGMVEVNKPGNWQEDDGGEYCRFLRVE